MSSYFGFFLPFWSSPQSHDVLILCHLGVIFDILVCFEQQFGCQLQILLFLLLRHLGLLKGFANVLTPYHLGTILTSLVRL